jgi:MoaA/NifB/PqqE/SkfB family radical SAM enzyme
MTDRCLTGKELEDYVVETLKFPMETLLKFPKYLQIETVNRCNSRCIMCGIDFDSKEKAVISDELFEKTAVEIEHYGDHVEKVMLYLDGEPLLDDNIHLRVERMKKAGVKVVNITSNASLLNPQRAERLIRAGLDEIHITLDSLKKEVYEAIRIGLNFDTVYKNIVGFVRMRDELNPALLIRIQMILQELNYPEVEDFKRHWDGILGALDQIAIQKAHNWANTADVMRFGDEDSINNVPCIAIWGTLVMHVNGDVPLCGMDTTTKVRNGNLNENTIAEIWKGDVYARVREGHLRSGRKSLEICNGCTMWREFKRELKSIS